MRIWLQTLSDVHKRAAYDNIFGFDEDAINPFKDRDESRDQVRQMPEATHSVHACDVQWKVSPVSGPSTAGADF